MCGIASALSVLDSQGVADANGRSVSLSNTSGGAQSVYPPLAPCMHAHHEGDRVSIREQLDVNTVLSQHLTDSFGVSEYTIDLEVPRTRTRTTARVCVWLSSPIFTSGIALKDRVQECPNEILEWGISQQ